MSQFEAEDQARITSAEGRPRATAVRRPGPARRGGRRRGGALRLRLPPPSSTGAWRGSSARTGADRIRSRERASASRSARSAADTGRPTPTRRSDGRESHARFCPGVCEELVLGYEFRTDAAGGDRPASAGERGVRRGAPGDGGGGAAHRGGPRTSRPRRARSRPSRGRPARTRTVKRSVLDRWCSTSRSPGGRRVPGGARRPPPGGRRRRLRADLRARVRAGLLPLPQAVRESALARLARQGAGARSAVPSRAGGARGGPAGAGWRGPACAGRASSPNGAGNGKREGTPRGHIEEVLLAALRGVEGIPEPEREHEVRTEAGAARHRPRLRMAGSEGGGVLRRVPVPRGSRDARAGRCQAQLPRAARLDRPSPTGAGRS
ncbi:MAG: hypothetical protein KatS3mg013_0472 [Actinomycetota bacterium]|nr:MAG: hypothetical protein KatS3mg013_0472 [Actinomycetota bacterium]